MRLQRLGVIILVLAAVPQSAGTAPDDYPPPPSRWILGPLYGTGCPEFSTCGNPTSPTMRSEVEYDLDQLARHDFPITGYHFDGSAWSSGKCEWALGDGIIERLRAKGIRALLHVWGGCTDTIDAMKLPRRLGDVFGGIYLDEGSSDAHARESMDVLRQAATPSVEIVMKAFSNDGQQTRQGLASLGHSAYVNDLPADFEGLRVGIRRVFEMASILPAPFNEFTGYDQHAVPDEETYFRRLHWGAMQVVMDHSAWRDADPWSGRYSQALIEAYRRYAWLHWELVPYLHSYDYEAYETGQPVLRAPDAHNYTVRIGEELFAAYVTQPGVHDLAITLPPGEWIDFWDDSRLLSGRIVQPVPLGREPIFVRAGAIIPAQVARSYTGLGTDGSAGSLTVLVYPRGRSYFRYRDEGSFWVDLTAAVSGDALLLQASPTPSRPVIYRVARWTKEPHGVRLDGRFVIAATGPGNIPRFIDLDLLHRSTFSGWHYDARTARLTIKVVP